MQADNRNQQLIGQAQQSQQQQQGLINQMMQGVNPQAYQAQARASSQNSMSQIASEFATRGLNSTGAMYTAGANATNQAYSNADAQYQRDRQGAYGMAIGAQGNMTQGYGQFVNPDPYAGFGQSLGALGQAGAQYNYQQGLNGGNGNSGVAMPGFGVTAPRLPGWSGK